MNRKIMTNILIVGAGIALLSGCGPKTGGEKIEGFYGCRGYFSGREI